VAPDFFGALGFVESGVKECPVVIGPGEAGGGLFDALGERGSCGQVLDEDREFLGAIVVDGVTEEVVILADG
jgi:hypothetical protein